MEDPTKSDRAATESTTVQTKHATKNLQKCFQVVGFILPQRYRGVYVLYSLLVNAMGCVLFPVAFVLSYWRLARSGLVQAEFGILLTSVQVFLSILCCIFKLLTLTLMRHRWRSAEAVMARLDRSCRGSPEEIDELRQCVRHCNRCVVFYTCAFWASTTSTLVGAYFKDRPPYNLYLPFVDWRRSRPEFLAACLIEFSFITVACGQQIFNDTFPVVYVGILRSHMKILLMRFAKLGSAELSPEENLIALKRCIHDHKNYLELYNIIAPIISITIFIQFVLTAFILGTTYINILLTDLSSRVGSFFYVVAIFLEILPVCYYAQCLMDESNKLAQVIFHSNWTVQNVRYRKMLVFLMQRTQCISDLTAGKLFPINLSCCLSIIKFSFTLYTFIKTMGLEDKFKMQ